MFRKSYWKKRFAPVLAGALVISSLLVPPGHAFAADPVTSEEQTVSPETPEVKDVTDSTDAATTDANLTNSRFRFGFCIRFCSRYFCNRCFIR